jgi:thioredoxin reductase
MDRKSDYEVIVVGGGIAGMTAALWLGRFRRRTLLLSAGPSRNAAAHALHGYPGYDGAPPSKLMDTLGHELTQYASVTRAEGRVATAAREGDRFCVSVGHREYTGSRILLATGIRDIKPQLPDFGVYEGLSIWHCPACDGHEYADKKLAILGAGEHLAGYVREFLAYTDQLSVVTNGSPLEIPEHDRNAFQRNGIPVYTEPVRALHGDAGLLKAVELDDGTTVEADAIFFSLGHAPRTELAEQLGCEVGDDGVVMNRRQETTVPGVYAAGDISPLEELLVVAAAMGAVAANNVHQSLDPGW